MIRTQPFQAKCLLHFQLYRPSMDLRGRMFVHGIGTPATCDVIATHPEPPVNGTAYSSILEEANDSEREL